MKNFNDFIGFSLVSNESTNILGGCGSSYGHSRSNSCNPCQTRSHSCGGSYTRPERSCGNSAPVRSCFDINFSFSFGCGAPKSCTPAPVVTPPVVEEIWTN
ncbi:MAG: hypothetical protein IPH28_12120 [Cytophagaceae bacterium]|nr:hypothetical protein [Cytophagaceae bacterium]MBK9511365.1 hypothetical protein [Cytophagaceae bacterium]MBK9932695.1 hypothetical protein [Cytophagaceae bacterium]MBL0303614.1 hypothetical protein [Cytophagaceae bacterium]MBL0326443.1 hypothetical protein [Cytophagaceae bacterium]